MSCIITYKGKKYSEEQFKEYFNNNKQEFTTYIAKNKDVIDSFKRKMEGIDFVFSQSPELASIGSKAQYLQYLSTIFKTSKVKDIVYRGGNLGTQQPQDVEAFTTNKSYAEYRAEQNNTQVYPAILNIQESKLLDKKEIRTLSLDRDEFEYQDYGFTDNKDQTKQLGNFYTVKENNRHILGSKQDIEGFKEFVRNKQFKKLTISYFKLNTKEDIRLLEKAETELLKEKIKEKSVLNINKNKIKFDNTSKQSNENLHEFKQQIGILISLFKEKGVNINLIEDKNEQSNEEGSVKQDKKNGDFIVTYSEPTGEVISHEILHIFVDMLGYNHPIVKKGIEQALKTQGAIELINLYKKKVPGKKESYYEKELLVTLAGQKAEEVMRDNPSGIPKWKFWVNQFFRKIGEIFGIERDYIKEIFEKMYSGSGIIKDFEFSEDEYLKIKNENPYKKYELFFHRRIRDIDEQILKNREKGTDTSELEQKKLLIMRTMVQYRNGSVESLKELGKATIDEFGKFLDKVEKGEVKMTNKNVIYVKNVIDTWKNFDDFSSVVSSYYKRIYPYLISWAIKDASEVSNKKITEEDIENDNVDIAWNEANFGTLVNVENILGYTIGKKIKIAQNKVTTLNRGFSKKMKHHIKNLKDYAKSNGMSLDEVYDLFTIEHNSTLWLTAPLEEGNVAEAKRKYDIIMNNENLRSFYSFLLDFNRRSNNILLTDKTISPLFFPNMKKGGMKDSLLKIIGIGKKNVDLDKIYQESTSFDELPIQFLKNLTPSQKERDLEKVFTYYAYWLNNYNVMSNLLPELRIIQDVIDYRYDDRVNEIIPRQYYSSMNKNKTIDGVNTNLHKIVDSYIDMQVKGKMKKEELKKEFITNAEQNEILTFNGAQVIDNLLMLNSLLKIGLSPITALANVGFGEISNILEGFGGRFYSLSDLRSATNIFFSQATNKDLSSMDEKDIPLLYKLNDKLNFLQELDDYESLTESGIGKKITKEKAMELMYSWQKKGEWFLQARTALAVLIHDGYLTKDGKETDKYKNATEEELESLGDKIQGINGYIHGRYSQREASIMHQYVLFRVLGQFKKWIPAAYERRFQGRRFNRRLGFETEGSYITFGRVVLKEIFLKGNIADGLMNMIIPLMGYKKALESGKLTELEIYNMRRLMLEIVLTTSLILGYASLYGDDDDKERRKRDPWIKFSLLLLDRISGDIEFWYNPSEWLRTVTNASLSRVVSDLLFVLNPIHWHYLFYLGDWEYERGSRKGENKSWSRIRRTIPGLKSFEDIKRITSKYTLEELQKPSINEIKKFIED